MLVRFVVGRVPPDQEGHAAAAAALQAEEEAFGDFMRLPDVEVGVWQAYVMAASKDTAICVSNLQLGAYKFLKCAGRKAATARVPTSACTELPHL